LLNAQRRANELAEKQLALMEVLITQKSAPIDTVPPSVPLVQGGTANLKPLDRAIKLLQHDPKLFDKSTRQLETETGINKNVWSRAKQKVS
jgi:hypothetical protein